MRHLELLDQLMLATVYKPGTDLTGWWYSEKLDGVFALWDGTRLWTREGEEIVPPPWFTQGWPDRVMVGELYIERGRFDPVSAAVRRKLPNEQEWISIRFHVFDLPTSTETFSGRLGAISELIEDAEESFTLRLVQHYPIWPTVYNEWLKQQLDLVLGANGEGLMLIDPDSLYTAGRTKNRLKYKAAEDEEGIVFKHIPGKGKHLGRMGALLVQSNNVIFKIGIGFTDAERENPPAVGSVITYSFNGRTPQGVPRFARYTRERPELDAPRKD